MRGRGTYAIWLVVLALTAGTPVLLAGCGGDDNGGQTSSQKQSAAEPAPELDTPQSPTIAVDVDTKDFPAADGKATISELIGKVAAPRDLAMAPGAQEFIQGKENRIPFALFTQDRKPVWGPTVVYIAKDAKSPAVGPFAAPAISLDVPEEFRSDNSKANYGKAGNAIYVANVEAPKGAAQVQVMTLSKVGDKYHATVQSLGFRKQPSTPAIGDKAIVIDNQTIADVGEENIAKIDTRVPPDDMHSVEMKQAVKAGKPVVLVFATPKFCVSRVCGPVVDVAAYLDSKYSDQAAFIHQEIYNNNVVGAGFTEAVGKYGLPTEPYTFVIDKNGRVAYKFEGPVTIPELEAAVRDVTGSK